MKGNGLSPAQLNAVNRALRDQMERNRREAMLAESVKNARSLGVPILYLADALGVSRSRIRVLAR